MERAGVPGVPIATSEVNSNSEIDLTASHYIVQERMGPHYLRVGVLTAVCVKHPRTFDKERRTEMREGHTLTVEPPTIYTLNRVKTSHNLQIRFLHLQLHV